MNNTNLLLLFGGESSEHEVSVSSAKNVYDAIDKEKYSINLCFIDKQGRWWNVKEVKDYENIEGLQQLLPSLGEKKFLIVGSDEQAPVDVILPILHGANGEDGTVQGVAKLSHIPVVGCKVTASAVCMDKVITKQLLEFNLIRTAPFMVHLDNDSIPNFSDICQKLDTNTLFVKPANSGSSVGVSRVSSEEELISAINLAHEHDEKVLIEKAVVGREIEVAVLGSGKSAKASEPGEIKPDREFYSYDSKYDDSSKTKVIIPAQLPDEICENIKSIALNAYSVLGCSGFSRIDFFLVDDKDIYLNEVNTIPGFTNISMYPKLWEHSGVPYSSLIDALIADALEK